MVLITGRLSFPAMGAPAVIVLREADKLRLVYLINFVQQTFTVQQSNRSLTIVATITQNQQTEGLNGKLMRHLNLLLDSSVCQCRKMQSLSF